MPTLTLTENGANGRAHDWSHVWTPFTEVRTLLNTTGLDYANVQTNGIRPSNVRSYQQVEMGRQRVRNATGGSLPISTIVYISGSYNDGTDDYPTVAKAQARSDGASLYAQGIIEATINDASDGTILFFKEVTGLNTSDDTVGDRVYLSGTVGEYTTTIPAAGTAVQIIGQVSKSHASTGVISFSFPGAVSPVAAALRVTEASGALTTSGTLATTGAATVASLVCTAGGTFGGGYGDTGVTISTAGVLQANGAITSDGAVTGATLAGTISTATQNSITSASSLATVGTITSGTWSGVIDGSATMTLGSDVTGDTYYRDASGFLERLAASTDGYVLTATGAGSIPAWEAVPTGVSLSGSTDNTVATVTGENALIGESALLYNGSAMFLSGDGANDDMAVGITIDQGTNDNDILAFKSSDIAHTMEDYTNTDTWGRITKNSATLGGMSIGSFCEDGAIGHAFQIFSLGGTAQTTKTTSSNALIFNSTAEVDASGSGNVTAAVTANGNIWGIRAYNGSAWAAAFIIDEDGDYHYNGADGGAFDEYDDVQLVRAFTLEASDPAKVIRTRFDEMVHYNKDALVEAGVLGYCSPEEEAEGHKGLVNGAQMQRLHTGAIWQLHTKQVTIEEELRTEIEGLRNEMLRLKEQN